ncbi:MAG: hypothetical protein JST44_22635 [Cyanobacteria bacterium SZAS LIN-5]|nr:hypothetical protein [Cyanobacteria bacterium SZAS LIN-5]
MASDAFENLRTGPKQDLSSSSSSLAESTHENLSTAAGSKSDWWRGTKTSDQNSPNGAPNDIPDANALKPGDHLYTTVVDFKTRHYEVHVPPNYNGSKPIPVMMMMPGMGGSIEQMKHETGMNRAADQRGFAVVYMEALPKAFPGTYGQVQSNGWNLSHGALTEKSSSYDDLNYVRQVNSELSRQLKVDPSAKYIVGFSEGGGAAQYVAQSMPRTFAGVGSVHGTRLESDPIPKWGDRTAFIAVLGDDDNMLPISGGHGIGEGWRLMKGFATVTIGKVSESLPLSQKTVWAQADGCGMPIVTDNARNKTSVYVCPGTRVTEIVRHGGMHAWDGLGQNPKNQITKTPDFGWPVIGVPNAKEDTTNDVVNALMPYRKDGRAVNMRRNFLEQ